MFQLVDSLDGNSSGGTHLVNLNTGVRVVVQNQLGCPFTDCATMRMPSLG